MDSFIWDFHYGNYASVQIKKKLDSLFSANQIRQKFGSANQGKASVRISTIAWHDNDIRIACAVESIFRKAKVFSKIDKFSQNFSDNNQNNQSGRFPVLQEEELEQQKGKKSEQEHIKTEHKDMVEYLQWVVCAAPRGKIIWRLILVTV